MVEVNIWSVDFDLIFLVIFSNSYHSYLELHYYLSFTYLEIIFKDNNFN